MSIFIMNLRNLFYVIGDWTGCVVADRKDVLAGENLGDHDSLF